MVRAQKALLPFETGLEKRLCLVKPAHGLEGPGEVVIRQERIRVIGTQDLAAAIEAVAQ
jgi:hypothetical protein